MVQRMPMKTKLWKDKAYFAYDTVYANSKDLAKRTIWDEILNKRAYEIAIKSKYDEHQRGLERMVYNFFDRNTGFGTKANVN